MSELAFIWTPKRTKKLFELRFEHDWLFKNKKQPWHEFHAILLKNGFPEDMTVDHVRKKWSYTYDTYRIAKREKRRSWKYYRMFEKHFGKAKILDNDKFESWNDEWRMKLIEFVSEASSLHKDVTNMWKQVELSLRTHNLPSDCCIQDLKALWHHLKSTFARKHRLKLRRSDLLSDWPLYPVMLAHHESHDRERLRELETDTCWWKVQARRRGRGRTAPTEEDSEFQWTKDITETFISIRIQHDLLFKEKRWAAWSDLQAIMVKEYGFPKTLNSREIGRKWASVFADYQKAVATKNTSWTYYNLFERYLGEGSFSFNPLIGWSEEWVLHFIDARIEFDHLFLDRVTNGNQQRGAWREVEKKLRSIGLPLDHSLFDIPELWMHLTKTFRWKRKFADRGTLTEHWPYYDAMNRYNEFLKNRDNTPIAKLRIKKLKVDDDGNNDDTTAVDDDNFDDDMKLFDLKRKLKKPKQERLDFVPCRACNTEEGSYNIFEACDSEGTDLASKLRVIGGVEIEKADSLPKQICFNCLKDLENAFSFRRKCLEADREQRTNIDNVAPTLVKVELDTLNTHDEADKSDYLEYETLDDCPSEIEILKQVKPKMIKQTKRTIRKKKVPKHRYEYKKMCEICGAHTSNLAEHVNMHSTAKVHSCDICNKTFKYKSGLQIHRAKHDPTPKKTCEVCGKTFHIVAQYKRHFVYHANERNYSCDACGKRFNTPDILKVHMRMHNDERPFSCPECGKSFRTAGCVSRHKRIVHKKIAKSIVSSVATSIDVTDNLPQQICLSCLKELEAAFSFRRKCIESDREHRNHHTTIVTVLPDLPERAPNVKLEIFDDHFLHYDDNVQESLEIYLPNKSDIPEFNPLGSKAAMSKKIKEKKKPKPAATNTNKVGRRKKKSHDRAQVCDICGKHSKDAYSLKMHLYSHTDERPFSCDICHKTFKSKSSIIGHMSIHLPRVPKKTCHMCGKSFPSVCKFNKHLERHANERKHACGTCGKRFNDADVLKVHARLHTGERNFSCPECGKTFKTSGCVTRHRRIVHKIRSYYRVPQHLKFS